MHVEANCLDCVVGLLFEWLMGVVKSGLLAHQGRHIYTHCRYVRPLNGLANPQHQHRPAALPG